MKKSTTILGLIALLATGIDPTFAELPDPGMTVTSGRTALVVTDPQNDFLSPKGDNNRGQTTVSLVDGK